MSSYTAPDANLTTFNPIDYYQGFNLLGGSVLGSGSSVDLAYIQANFLQYPKSQGSENIVGVLNATSGVSSGSSVSASTFVQTPNLKTSVISPGYDPNVGLGVLLIGDDETIYTEGVSVQVGGITTTKISDMFCAGLHLQGNGIRTMANADNLYLGGNATIGVKNNVQVAKLLVSTDGTIENYDATPIVTGGDFTVTGVLSSSSSITAPSITAPIINATTSITAPTVDVQYITTPVATGTGKGVLNICNNDTTYPNGVDIQAGGVSGRFNSTLSCAGISMKSNSLTSVTDSSTIYLGANSTGAKNITQVSKLAHFTDGTIQNYDGSSLKIGGCPFVLSSNCNTPALTTSLYGTAFTSIGNTNAIPSVVFSQNLSITDPAVSFRTVYCDTTDPFTLLPVNTTLTDNTYKYGFRMNCGFSYGAGGYSNGAYYADYGVYNSTETVYFGGAVLFITIPFNSPFVSVPLIQITGRIAQASNPLCIGLQYAVDSYTTTLVNGIVYYTGFIFNVCNIRSGEGNTAGQAWGVNWSATGKLR